MHEDEDQARVPRAAVEVALSIAVVMRSYLSSNFLWASRRNVRLAEEIENGHSGNARFDIEHRGLVLFAIVGAVTFLEGMVNELFQDVADGHGLTGDGYVSPIPVAARRSLAGWWAAHGNSRTLAKYQALLSESGHEPLDEDGETYRNASLTIDLRNVLMHYLPRSVRVGRSAKGSLGRIQNDLRAKFPDNALMRGSGNPWWPSHALGAGCAGWAVASASKLADEVSARLGIQPNYQRVDFDGP